MSGDSHSINRAPLPPPPPPKSDVRGRSTVDFTYTDLSDAEKIATGVRDLGGTACEWDQLAGHLKMAPKGGGFRLLMIGAKSYGLLTYARGEVELTELGIRIVDPRSVRGARFDAFMSVPLYKQTFDRLGGTILPPPSAIERMFESFGVAPKQKDKARQVFMRSAKQAGLFEIAADRLTKPINLNSPSGDAGNSGGKPPSGAGNGANAGAGGNGGGGGEDQKLHPFIQGLLEKLPPPETEWRVQDRAKWLQTSANIFDLLYSDIVGGEDIVVSIKKGNST